MESFQQDPTELLSILDDTASALEAKEKFSEAVSVLWQALHLRVESMGRDSVEVATSSEYLIKLLNKLAVQSIRDGQYDECISYLGRALKLSEPDAVPHLEHYRILTLNNASCCHRRLGNTQLALKYAKDALDVGFQTRDDKSLACSHLNACSVLSQAGRHEEALRHARDAVNASLQALRTSQEDPTSMLDYKEGQDLDDEEKARLNQEQLATLCIAYHNAGVEFEHLGRKECMQLYRRALNLAEMHLPRKRKMAAKFRSSLQSAQRTTMGNTSGRDEAEESLRGRGGGKRMRPSSAPGQRQSRLPPMSGSSKYNEETSSPSHQISTQLKLARERVLELEREMAGTSTTEENNMRKEGEPAEDMIETKKEGSNPSTNLLDARAVREELDELHERTHNAILSVQNMNQKSTSKKNKKIMMSSASEPMFMAGGHGGGSDSSSPHTQSAQSLQIESAGMVVMGPGLNSGVGPIIAGGKKSHLTQMLAATKKKMRKRPSSAGPRGRKNKKKLPPWARSKAPDFVNMPEEHLVAIRIFYQLNVILEKKRARAMDIFREFDDDDSGTINGKELRLGCRALGIHITKSQRKAVFDMIDDDKSGDLDYMELAKEIKKAGKHPPPFPPIDAAEEAVIAAANDSMRRKKIQERKDRSKSPLKKKKKAILNKKLPPPGPPKLSAENMIKWCAGRLVSDINLRAYLGTHNIMSPSDQRSKDGKTVLHSLCGNSHLRSSLPNALKTFFNAHVRHKEQASVEDEFGSTPLHLLAANPQGTLVTIKTIRNLAPSVIHLVDQKGKTPLMYSYERSCLSPLPDSLKVVDYLLKVSCLPIPAPSTKVFVDNMAGKTNNSKEGEDNKGEDNDVQDEITFISDRPHESMKGPLSNNPLHSLLWSFSRETITSACALYLSDRLIKLQPSMLREKNAHGVTPITMAESSFSKDLQKLYRAAAAVDYTSETKAYDILKNNDGTKSPKKKLKQLHRWSSVPDFEAMDPVKLTAVRVFYHLYLVCDEKKMRPLDVFLDFDVDDSGTVSKGEFSKGLKNLGIKLTKKERNAVFKVMAKEGVAKGELEYLEIQKEIKKAGKYPPPPKQLTPSPGTEGITAGAAGSASAEVLDGTVSPKKKMKRKRKKKKPEIILTPEQAVWNKVYNLMEKKRVKPVHLFHDIDTDESGIITADELRDGFKNLLDIVLTDVEFHAALLICDRDRSNEIDYKEFARAVKYGSPQRIESMNETKLKLEKLKAKGLKKEKSVAVVITEEEEDGKKKKKKEKKTEGKGGDEAGGKTAVDIL